jgi:hypothetical protein
MAVGRAAIGPWLEGCWFQAVVAGKTAARLNPDVPAWNAIDQIVH